MKIFHNTFFKFITLNFGNKLVITLHYWKLKKDRYGDKDKRLVISKRTIK